MLFFAAVFEVFAVVAVAVADAVVVFVAAAVVVGSSDAAVVVFVVFAFVAVASDVVVVAVVVVTSKFVAADENLDPVTYGKVRLRIFKVAGILVFICLNFLYHRNYKKYFINFLE